MALARFSDQSDSSEAADEGEEGEVTNESALPAVRCSYTTTIGIKITERPNYKRD